MDTMLVLICFGLGFSLSFAIHCMKKEPPTSSFPVVVGSGLFGCFFVLLYVYIQLILEAVK